MECPYCGKVDDKVIDSRPTKEGFAIYRRRQCLVCGGRFTTYESTAEQLLPALIRKHMGRGDTITSVKTVLTFLTRVLRPLTKETEALIVKMDKLEKARTRAVRKSKRRAAVKIRAKRRTRVKKPPVRKAPRLSDTAQVLKIIHRHKRGVDLKKLKDRTGYQDNKIRDIVSRACKTGKIQRVSRGVYIAAE